jgi:hypothetical protein
MGEQATGETEDGCGNCWKTHLELGFCNTV